MTKLWAALADSLVDPDRPGDFNQVLLLLLLLLLCGFGFG